MQYSYALRWLLGLRSLVEQGKSRAQRGASWAASRSARSISASTRNRPILMVATAVLLLALSYSPLLLSPHRPSPTSRHALLKLCDASAATDESPPAVLIEALGDDRAAEIWERRPPGALPNEKKQAALIDWLQTGPLEADPANGMYFVNKARLRLSPGAMPTMPGFARRSDVN